MAYQDHPIGALGDRTRRAIFERLADGPLSVGEIAKGLRVTRPAVSQHLKVLKDAGLVVDRPVGNRRLYQLNTNGVGALRAYLDQLWTRALAGFKAAVEEAADDDSVTRKERPSDDDPMPKATPTEER